MELSFDDDNGATTVGGTESSNNNTGRVHEADVLACAQVLSEHKARDTVALYISEVCGFTDYMVIATANSVAHARGLQKQVLAVCAERGLFALNGNKRQEDNSWTLIDLGFAVVNIMTEETRTFYELERLWFTGSEVFRCDSQ